MATELINSFTSYHLTEEEQLAGQVLNTFQKTMIQNYISEAAHQKLALVFDPEDIKDYGMQMAFLTGKLEILQYILTVSEEALVALATKSQSNQQ